MSSFKLEISALSPDVLCDRIKNGLNTNYDRNIGTLALKYIEQEEIDTTQELLADIESGSKGRGSKLIDHIISSNNTQIEWNNNNTNKLLQVIINSVNGVPMAKLPNPAQTVTKIEHINWCNHILHNHQYSDVEQHPKMKNTRQMLVKQMGDWFNTLGGTTTQLIVTLFTIARENGMPDLFTTIFSILAENTFSHMIEKRNRMVMLYIIKKSKAFLNLDETYKNLLMEAIEKYQRVLAPLPMSYLLGQSINDSLYDYINYTYIFSEIVNELMENGHNDNLFQIDLWMIPKNMENTLQMAIDEISSACSDDSDSDDSEDSDYDDAEFEDKFILNIKQRLQDIEGGYKSWNNVNWTSRRFKEIMRRIKEEIKSMLCRNVLLQKLGLFDLIIGWCLRNSFHSTFGSKSPRKSSKVAFVLPVVPVLPVEVKQIIWKYSQLRLEMNMNRIICIIDRREWYYDVSFVSHTTLPGLTNANTFTEPSRSRSIFTPNTDTKSSSNPGHKRVKTIEANQNKITSKNYDEVYLYNPPKEYCLFQDRENLIEHSIRVSRDYILPECILRERIEDNDGLESAMDHCYGLGYSFAGQAFAVSFCCLKKNYCHMNWFVNGWNLRISKAENIPKFWSRFFSNVTDDEIEKIDKEIITKWKLKLKDETYAALERDILRF